MYRISLRKLALLFAAVVALLVVTSAPVSAGEDPDYPAPDCSLSVSPENPPAGSEITISGTGWPAGASVTVTVDGEELDPVTADENGDWEIQHTLGPDQGDVEITADGCEGAEDEVLGTTVTVGPAAVAGGDLPATGSSSTEPLVRTGAVLIAAGAVLVYAVRRRSQAAAG